METKSAFLANKSVNKILDNLNNKYSHILIDLIMPFLLISIKYLKRMDLNKLFFKQPALKKFVSVFIIIVTFSQLSIGQLALSNLAPGNWSNASNWTTAALNNAVITNGVTVTFNSTTVGIAIGDLIYNAAAVYVGTVQSVVPGVSVTLTAAAAAAAAANTIRVRHIPIAADNISINGGNITLDQNGACNTLVVANTLTFDATQRTLDVGGNLSGAGTINMSSNNHILQLAGALNAIGTFTTGANTSTVEYDGVIAQGVFTSVNYRNLVFTGASTKTLAGNITVNENLTINTGAVLDANTRTIAGVATKFFTVSVGAEYRTSNTAVPFATLIPTANYSLLGKVIFNAAGNYTLPFNATNPATYNEIDWNGAGIKTLGGALTISGNINVNAGTLADGGFAITGAVGRTLTVAAGASYTTTRAAAIFPTNLTMAFNATSTMNFNAIGAYTLPATPASYGNLNINGNANIKTLSVNTTIAGNLAVNNGTLQLSTFDLSVSGSTTVVATINDNSATGTNSFTSVIMNGGTISSNPTSAFTINTTLAASLGNGTLGQGNFIVNGATTIAATQTLTISSLTGTKTFNGDVTINGIWTNAINSPITFAGNLYINAGATFTCGAGLYSFTGIAKEISGTLGTVIINDVDISGSITNRLTGLTINTDLSGAGSLTQFNSSGLYLGGTCTLSNPIFSTPTNTVYYTNTLANQTVLGTTYSNLYIDKTGRIGSLGANTVILGSLTCQAGTFAIGAFTLTLNNPILGTATNMTGGATSSLIIQGSSAVNIPSSIIALNNLTLNNSAGSTLQAGLTLSGTLTLTSGRLTLGTNNLTLSIASTLAGVPSAINMVETNSTGMIIKNFNNAVIFPFQFPIGTATGPVEFAPVSVSIPAGGGAAWGWIGFRTVYGKDPNNSSSTDYLNRYWVVSYGGGWGARNMTPTVTFPTGDINAAGSGANTYGATWNGTTWTLNGAAIGVGGTTFTTAATALNGVLPLSYSGVDGVAPTVVGTPTPTPAIIADAQAGGNNFTISVIFSEAMDIANTPAAPFSFAPTVAGKLTFSSGAWTNGNKTYTATYFVSDDGSALTSYNVTVAPGFRDLQGNLVTGTVLFNNLFQTKFSNPTITAATFLPSPIIVSTLAFTVTLTFSEAMNNGIAPVISYPVPVENPGATLTSSGSAWNGPNTICTMTYTVSNQNMTIPNIDVSIGTARDSYGNLMQTYSGVDRFSIDMQAPTVLSITPTAPVVRDAIVGTGTFSLDIVFSKPMDQAVAFFPVITFPTAGENPNNPTVTLTVRPNPNSNWTNATTFHANYTVADAGTQYANLIDAQVQTARDLGTNVMTAQLLPNVFNVDTRNATVSSVTPSIGTIVDGTATFTLTVIFDENMNTSGGANPNILFPTAGENPASTISFTSGSWSSATTYIANYTVFDAGQNMLNIDVRVQDGQDQYGNVQNVSNLATNNFSIIMDNPTVTLLTLNVATILTTTPTFTIAATFSKAMNNLIAPAISFPTENPTCLTFSGGAWNGPSTIYTATYTITNNGMYLPNIDVRVQNARDPSGNIQTIYNVADRFNVDLSMPTFGTTIEAAALTFTEYVVSPTPTPINVTTTLDVTDARNDLIGATVTLVGFVAAQDVLSFTPTINVTGSYNSGTGILTLTGNAPASEYRDVFRSVTYVNNSKNPTTTARTLQFRVSDGVYGVSVMATRALTVVSVNNPPVFTSTPITFSQGGLLYSYTITGTDPDFTLTNANFSFVTKPAWLNWVSPTLSGTIPTIPAYTNYSVTVQITDGGTPVPNQITTQTFNIAVNAGINVPGNFPTIQQAINATTANGDQVFVANGTYNENIVFPTGRNIEVIGFSKAGVIINGGAAGSTVTFPTGNTSILKNVTVTNGSGTNSNPGLNNMCVPGYYGGGIYMLNASPTIDNCIIQNNISKSSSVAGATIGGSGAGIYIGGGTPYISNTSILNNTSQIYRGGGVCIDNATVTFENVDITNNQAGNYGSGLAACSSTINFIGTGNIIQTNTSTGVNGLGGGVMLLLSRLNLLNTNITSNTATISGNNIYGVGAIVTNNGGSTYLPGSVINP